MRQRQVPAAVQVLARVLRQRQQLVPARRQPEHQLQQVPVQQLHSKQAQAQLLLREQRMQSSLRN